MWWYLSNRFFSLDNPESNSDLASDFTQMIWSSNTDVGLSMISYRKIHSNRRNYECIIFVAVYAPGGNIPGEYGENVLPIIF
jgi:hypothetical protein